MVSKLSTIISGEAVKLAKNAGSLCAVNYVNAATKALIKTNKYKLRDLKAAQRKAHKYLRKHREFWVRAAIRKAYPQFYKCEKIYATRNNVKFCVSKKYSLKGKLCK